MRRDLVVAAALLLAGCAGVAPPPPPVSPPAPMSVAPAPVAPAPAPPPDPSRYSCDGARVVHLRPADDSLTVEGLEAGPQVLLRDAGGVGPQQSVWSNDVVRVELGLGAAADEADVHLLAPATATWHCHQQPTAG